MERGSWPAGREALSGVDVSLRSRRGGLYRGAGLLARWLRDFARSGRLAALVEAACIVERGSWPAGRATSRGVDVSLRSWRRPGGPPYVRCPTYSDASLRSWRRPGGPPHVAPRTVPYVQCPTYSALRTVPHVQCPMYSALRTVTPRFAREGGPDRIGQADPFAEPRQRTVRYER